MKKIIIISVLIGSIFLIGNMFVQNYQEQQTISGSEVELQVLGTQESQTTKVESDTKDPQTAYEINMDNYSFSQTELIVKSGEEITITLNNLEGNHDLVIDELNVHSDHFKPGESGEMIFTVGKEHIGKTYEFYCSVGSHRELGMVGTITIVE